VRERRGRKRLGIGRGKRRVARDVNGKGGMEKKREGSTWIFVQGLPSSYLRHCTDA